jgi:teichuronic acid biosynthesis glycosyltransferase TuaH
MLLQNKDIVILALARFDGPYESTSYTIARFLARQNRVFYVEHPYTWKDIRALRNSPEIGVRKEKFSNSSDGLLDTDLPGLKIVVTPPVLPTNFFPEGAVYRLFHTLPERTIVNRIRKVLREQRVKDFVFINSHNFHFPGVGAALQAALKAYHCVDPLIVPYDRKHGLVSEKQIVQQSDVVICTSRELYQEKKRLNPNTHFIPNAADVSHSSKALDPGLQIHPALDGVKKPVIGYFGNIERRMDYELIKQVVETNRDKSFVFAGPVEREYVPEWFSNQPNIVTPGRLPTRKCLP